MYRLHFYTYLRHEYKIESYQARDYSAILKVIRWRINADTVLLDLSMISLHYIQ